MSQTKSPTRGKSTRQAEADRVRPKAGGSWSRDPETGKLKREQHTRPRTVRQHAGKPDEPGTAATTTELPADAGGNKEG